MTGNMTGRLLGNRYQITERIGIGGMAEVYRAQDTVLGRMVAVKVMLPQYAEDETFTTRFRQEAAAAANLSSPYIVNVYDWGHDNNTHYIVMEFVRGSDLKTAIIERGAINQRKVAEIGSQVCQALSVAHNLDIIHRDIKPQNIMVQPDGNVKVMDFGIARAKNSIMAKTSSVLGTAHYISPEQAQGQELTPASDIYSLGVVLYESVTGKLPFDGPDAVSVAMKQVQETPVPPSQINPAIDPALESIILKAMSKNPAERFATANDMRRVLNDHLAGRPVHVGDFDQAPTAAIAGGAVPPLAPAYATEQTSVMPSVEHGGYAKPPNSNNYLNNNMPPKKKSKKRTVAIVVAVIAALAIIAAVAFALLGGNAHKNGIEVPDVSGMTLTEATTLIENAGFEVGTVEHVYSDTVAADSVVSQDPRGGSKAEKGSRINLKVSQGTEQVEVPDLSNMTAGEARQALQDAGLSYEAGTAEYSDTVEKDRVARQDPAAGTSVAKGSTVTYYLSIGKEGTAVPNVVGQSEGAATTTLNNAGFQVTTEYRSDSSVPAGNVISQTPSSGETIKSGSTVHLVVSSGTESFSVSVAAGPGGSVNPSSLEVESGGSATINYYADSGYVAVGANDTNGNVYTVSGTSGTITVSNVTSNISITVNFAAATPPSGDSGDTGDKEDSTS